MNLSAFMVENAAKIKNVKYVVFPRFNDEDGNPVPCEIKPITGTDDEAIRKSCMKRVPISGKRGQ